MDSYANLEKVKARARARCTARRVLGVGDDASAEQIKEAWRRLCLRTHPDRNPEDPDAEEKFRKVNCAYGLLIEGTPCEELLLKDEDADRTPSNGRYDMSNTWGFYLWWRETFF
jgi:curved DNA-binding protein CbpA